MHRTGKWTWAAALALTMTLAGVPGHAQLRPENTEITDEEPVRSEEQDNAAPVRPLEGMDEAQLLAFFELMSANAELESLLAPMIETITEPGEAVSGWRESGVDIHAEIGARAGGLAGNLLRDDDTEVLSITDLSATNAPDLTGFTRLRLRAAPPGGANEQSFASFSPGVWLALEMQHTRRGNALCYKGLNGVTLYSEEPLTTWDEDTAYLMAAMVATFDRIAAREFCVVYQREGDAYAARSFLPDGRSLPQMDAQSTLLRIMPAAELSAFMRDAVPEPMTDEE
jgi:hypothetical protein